MRLAFICPGEAGTARFTEMKANLETMDATFIKYNEWQWIRFEHLKALWEQSIQNEATWDAMASMVKGRHLIFDLRMHQGHFPLNLLHIFQMFSRGWYINGVSALVAGRHNNETLHILSYFERKVKMKEGMVRMPRFYSSPELMMKYGGLHTKEWF